MAAFIQLKIRRGLEVDLPILADGELGYCTDSDKLFVGFGGINKEVNMAYTPAFPADWAGSPTTLADAIDRMAAVVAVLNGGPIT